MTPFLWCFLVLTAGPVVSLFAVWLLHPSLAHRVANVFLVASGIGGVVASVYQVLAEAPFELSTSVFFGMVASFDKFSALFLLPSVFVVAVLAFLAWSQIRDEKLPGRVMHSALVLLTIGITWTVLAGNIIGFIAALLVFGVGKALSFIYSGRQEGSRLVMILAPYFLGCLLLAAGLFVASSGALFSPFTSLTYIANELDPTRLMLSFGLIVLGVIAINNSFASKKVLLAYNELPNFQRALINIGEITLPLYILARLVLFIFPAFSIWYVLPVGIIALLGMMKSVRNNNLAGFYAALGLLMFVTAMTFQTLALYEAMNAVLFGMIISLIGAGISVTAEAVARSSLESDKFEKSAKIVIIAVSLGLLPSCLFIAQWLFGSSILSNALVMPRYIALGLLMALVGTLISTWILVYKNVGRIREIISSNPAIQYLTPVRQIIIGLAAIGAIIPFFIPKMLNAIGATPLTNDVDVWQAGLVAGDATLRLGVIALLSIGAAAFVWFFRIPSVDQPLLMAEVEAIEPPPEPSSMSNKCMVWCSKHTNTVNHKVIMPVQVKIVKIRTWYDGQSDKTKHLSLVVLVATVGITLIISL